MPRDRVEYLWELMIELREEILSRQKVRVQIYGFKIGILTLLFTYIAGNTDIMRNNSLMMNNTGNYNLTANNEVSNLIILLPAIASVLLDSILTNQDYGIKRIGFFSREFLEPAIRRELKWPKNELLWEEYMIHPDLRAKFGVWGNIGTTAFVFIIAFLFILIKYPSDRLMVWTNIPKIYFLCLVLFLFILYELRMIYRLKNSFDDQFKKKFWSTYEEGDDPLIDKYIVKKTGDKR